jgi:hypothetical protein
MFGSVTQRREGAKGAKEKEKQINRSPKGGFAQTQRAQKEAEKD